MAKAATEKKTKEVGGYIVHEIAPSVVTVSSRTLGALVGNPVAVMRTMADGMAVAKRYQKENRRRI